MVSDRAHLAQPLRDSCPTGSNVRPKPSRLGPSGLVGAPVVESADRLFCTLDPTMRRLVLDPPVGFSQKIELVLVDTIGFISDLPPELVAAFEATLSELKHADLLLHVRDVSSLDFERQKSAVVAVLQAIGISSTTLETRTLEIWNKIDKLPEAELLDRLSSYSKQPNCRPAAIIPVSATTGDGFASLLNTIARHITLPREQSDNKSS